MKNNKLVARRVRIGIAVWCASILVVACFDPRPCAAMAGMVAVMNLIANRVEFPPYPKRISDVQK